MSAFDDTFSWRESWHENDAESGGARRQLGIESKGREQQLWLDHATSGAGLAVKNRLMRGEVMVWTQQLTWINRFIFG